MFHFNKIKVDWLSFSLFFNSIKQAHLKLEEITLYFRNFSPSRLGSGKYGFAHGIYYQNGLLVLYSPDLNYIHLSFSSSAIQDIGFKNILNFMKDYNYKVSRFDLCIDTNLIRFNEIQEKYFSDLFVSRFRSSSFINSKKNKIQARTLYFGSRQSDSFLRIYEKSKEIFLKTGKVVPEFIRIEFEFKNGVARKMFDMFIKGRVNDIKGVFLNYIEFKEKENKSRIYNFKTWDKWVLLFNKLKKVVGSSRVLRSPDVVGWLKRQVSKSLYFVAVKYPEIFNEILIEGEKKYNKDMKFCLT
ncbi:replication initiation factor domain-containing protein [Caminibacter sp.]